MNDLNLNQKSEDEKLFRGLGISFAVHAFLFSFFILKTVFFTSESIDYSQAVRVDIVGLPDKVAPATPPPPSAEEPKATLPTKEPDVEKTIEKPVEKVVEKKPEALPIPKQKEPDSISLEKTQSKQKNALDKLKAMAALEKIKAEAESERAKKAQGNGKANLGSVKIKGNVLSPGTSLTGIAKLQHDTYVSDLDQHIKKNWSLPEWLAKRDLKAQAVVYIDSRGNILGRKIVKTSGNPNYDDEVLETIDRSAPFPAPPEKFVAVVSVDGILIGFPE